MDSPLITSIIIIVGLLGLLAAGVWIFAAMLVVSIVGLYVLNDYSFVRIGSMLTSVQWKTMTSLDGRNPVSNAFVRTNLPWPRALG